jgi:hypothetical protein
MPAVANGVENMQEPSTVESIKTIESTSIDIINRKLQTRSQNCIYQIIR